METAAVRWTRVLQEAEASELTQAAFARSNGINPGTLAWWKWRLRQAPVSTPSAQADFVEVVVSPPTPSLRVQVGDRPVHALVNHDTDMTLLRQVVEALC